MNESVDNILSEMREDDVRIAAAETPKTEALALRYACDWIKGYADRIEAAHKREIEELQEYLKANSIGVKAMHEEIKTLRDMITDLRSKLKVSEDALGKLQERFVASVHDGTFDPHDALKIAEVAIAEIRKEGEEDGRN